MTRVDCNATDHTAATAEHRCCLEPGHDGNHLCHGCRHTWTNTGLVLATLEESDA